MLMQTCLSVTALSWCNQGPILAFCVGLAQHWGAKAANVQKGVHSLNSANNAAHIPDNIPAVYHRLW